MAVKIFVFVQLKQKSNNSNQKVLDAEGTAAFSCVSQLFASCVCLVESVVMAEGWMGCKHKVNLKLFLFFFSR